MWYKVTAKSIPQIPISEEFLLGYKKKPLTEAGGWG